ncbi:hypothetical protein J1N35_021554 [Gossypium stocksii]|uniref:Uncharacterized protein n=1 Tax=Gossypium stocksii TaxID=47602 RepID=A0A9D3VEY5_9ROSI|nr:hypothetical protein J1N35_021554 [Gossypium stocksii]
MEKGLRDGIFGTPGQSGGFGGPGQYVGLSEATPTHFPCGPSWGGWPPLQNFALSLSHIRATAGPNLRHSLFGPNANYVRFEGSLGPGQGFGHTTSMLNNGSGVLW